MLAVAGTSGAQINAARPDSVFDVVLRGGVLYDGSGTKPRRADVGIIGGRIASIGDLSQAEARQSIEVQGLAVAPGFIDMHSHASGVAPEASVIFAAPAAENLIRQGITTIVGGQDGRSPIPVAPFLEALDQRRPAVNFALMAGHGSIRYLVMRNAERAPTDAELDRMQAMLRRALDAGAFGLSTGLEYVPGTFAETDELATLGRTVADYDGLHLTHIRNEAAQVVEAVHEAITIAERSGVRTQITHHAIHGRANWGRSTETLALIDEALGRGLRISMDQFPYTHVNGSSWFFFPDEYVGSGSSLLSERLADPETRSELAEHVRRELLDGAGGGDPSQIVITNIPSDPSLRGRTLAEVMAARGMEGDTGAAVELLLELQARGGFHAFLPVLSEEDVRRILAHPATSVATDAGIAARGSGWPHPASYGAFPRVLGHYARDAGLITLQEAVRKMTGLPAEVLGLDDRGVIREGAFADLVVFDPSHVADRSAYTSPHQHPDGILHVLVNGTLALHDGRITGERPGRVLRRNPEAAD